APAASDGDRMQGSAATSRVDSMIEIATSPATTTLVIAGDLDLAERDQFPEIAARVVGLRRQLLVIDMCRVTFMDSTGAAFLISLADSGRPESASEMRNA